MNISKPEIIGYIILIGIILFFGISNIKTSVHDYRVSFETRKGLVPELDDLRIKMETITTASAQRAQEQEVLKPFFQADTASQDSIASFGGMFEDIIDYVKMNGLMLRSVQYNINPENDMIFKNFSANYNTCEVSLYLVGTYTQLQQFINSIFEYPYYINISNIEISPYESNKKYLMTNISINLYSKK